MSRVVENGVAAVLPPPPTPSLAGSCTSRQTFELPTAVDVCTTSLDDAKVREKKKANVRSPDEEECRVVVRYTDGSCLHNGSARARAGVGVYAAKGSRHNRSLRFAEERPTNQRAELSALIVAMHDALDSEPSLATGDALLRIYADSQYAISCATQWIRGWVKNGWKTANGKPVQSRELMEAIDAHLQLLPRVEFVHVKAHVGHEENEAADKLARDGCDAVEEFHLADWTVETLRAPPTDIQMEHQRRYLTKRSPKSRTDSQKSSPPRC